MKKARYYIGKVVTLVLAFQIINLGLFAQDFTSFSFRESMSYINVINSVDEYLVEVVLNHKNAVPEESGHHHKTPGFQKHINMKLAQPQREVVEIPYIEPIAANRCGFRHIPFGANFKEILAPPPKA